MKKREEKLKNKFGNAWNLERLLSTPEEELTDELKEWERQAHPNYPFSYIKVIGNIYENSDLLSEVKDGSTITKAERSNA